MNNLSRKQLRGLFSVIEINLFLWLVVAGTVWQSSAENSVKYLTAVGFVVAAVLQHWAYYKLYRKAR